jgi:hypothetical protein
VPGVPSQKEVQGACADRSGPGITGEPAEIVTSAAGRRLARSRSTRSDVVDDDYRVADHFAGRIDEPPALMAFVAAAAGAPTQNIAAAKMQPRKHESTNLIGLLRVFVFSWRYALLS